MTGKPLRGLIVGASTLLGKELAEELNAADWDLRLADVGEADGQIVSAGDEALLIQPLSPGVFAGIDFVFFAETEGTSRTHWREAQNSGASVLDLTGALEGEAGVLVRSPWITGGKLPDLTTVAVVPAHTAAVMLGLVATRLAASFGDVHLAATVLEPASQQGSGGLDEMHQQTVSLLGFHTLPQEVYDAQVAFNLRVRLGEAAKLDMDAIAARIRRHLGAIAGAKPAGSVEFQLVQAPVFHGYTMSVFVELGAGADAAAVRKALEGGAIQIAQGEEDSPSNQSVMEDAGIKIAISEAAGDSAGRGYWLWMAADNLKLAARHAAACAAELAALRPADSIQ